MSESPINVKGIFSVLTRPSVLLGMAVLSVVVWERWERDSGSGGIANESVAHKSANATRQGEKQAAVQSEHIRQSEEQERIRAEEEARRKAKEENRRHEELVRTLARRQGNILMENIGGGQDLVVYFNNWDYFPHQDEYRIPIEVRFNGSVVRSNQYLVRGILHVGADGGNPRFYRDYANQNYRDQTVNWLLLQGAHWAIEEYEKDKKQR